MGDASLSQDEINALLQEADDLTGGLGASTGLESGDTGGGGPSIDDAAAREIANVIVSAQASSLSTALAKEARMSVVSAAVQNLEDAVASQKGAVLLAKVGYSAPASGSVFYIIKSADALSMVALTLGSKPPSLNENAMMGLQDVINQMASGPDAQVSSEFGFNMMNTGPKLSAATVPGSLAGVPAGQYYAVQTKLEIPGSVNSTMVQLYPMPFINSLISSRNQGGGGIKGMDDLLGGGMDDGGISIQGAEFSPLTQTAEPAVTGNINLLLDVPMEVTVELGRASKTVKEVLSLGEGSIIELDKLAGEPVDLLVNGKPIAKGEVVVIDENFGVRVTEIVSPKNRMGKQDED